MCKDYMSNSAHKSNLFTHNLTLGLQVVAAHLEFNNEKIDFTENCEKILQSQVSFAVLRPSYGKSKQKSPLANVRWPRGFLMGERITWLVYPQFPNPLGGSWRGLQLWCWVLRVGFSPVLRQ
jgi:hypothetical protein